MPLQVIGAGFGRTGTLSLKLALEQLGIGRCYHMTEVFARPDHVAIWHDAARGRAVDWDRLFADYAATVDWPGCSFWRELSAHYPDAKVVLTLRDPGSWYASVGETIYPVLRRTPEPALAEWHAMATHLIDVQTFGRRFGDRAHAIGVFERHAEAVRRAIPAERLLVYEVAEGWGPLCAFLGLPVPATEFPRVNSKEEFRARAGMT